MMEVWEIAEKVRMRTLLRITTLDYYCEQNETFLSTILHKLLKTQMLPLCNQENPFRTGNVLLGKCEQVFHSEEQLENIIMSKMKHSLKKFFISCFKHKCYHYIIRKTHFQYARAGNAIIYTRSASYLDILNIFNCRNVIFGMIVGIMCCMMVISDMKEFLHTHSNLMMIKDLSYCISIQPYCTIQPNRQVEKT